MLAILKLSVLAAMAAAQVCGPDPGTPEPSTTSKPPTQPSSNPSGGHVIHPGSHTGLCVDVAGANFANGTPVQV